MSESTTKAQRHEDRRKPELTLRFKKGNYHDAILAYQECKMFACSNGLTVCQNLAGVINSPTYKGQKCGGGTLPVDWDLSDPEWEVTMDFWVDDDGAFLGLQMLHLPENAEWVKP